MVSLNWAAVGLSVLVTFVSGFVWFGPRTFFWAWWRAMGKGPDEQPSKEGMGKVFGGTFVGIVVQAFVLAYVIGAIRAGQPDFGAMDGLRWGFSVGLCAAAAALGHRLFAGHGFKAWAIEVGNDVLNFTLMGVILGAMK